MQDMRGIRALFGVENGNDVEKCLRLYPRTASERERGFDIAALVNAFQSHDYPHLSVAYNGEIYNRRQLIATYGFPDESSDADFLLRSYCRVGVEETARALDGIFAFCIVDTKHRTIHLGRDTFGVKPLFSFYQDGTLYVSQAGFLTYNTILGRLGVCSETKGLIDVPSRNGAPIDHFPPGHVQSFEITDTGRIVPGEMKSFLKIGECDLSGLHLSSDPLANIRYLFKEAVKKRLPESDVPVCSFLSGGLDSSLVASVVVECMKERGFKQKVKTFSIGTEASSDIQAARIVAKHLGTDHHEIPIPAEKGLAAMRKAIYLTETFEVVTLRGVVPQLLASEYVKEKMTKQNVNPIICFAGDGADELSQGYTYFFNAPSAADADVESRWLLQSLHVTDLLRVDRVTTDCGIDVRLPYLDNYLTSYILSLPPEDRQPQKGFEKYLIRRAFECTGLLPDKILWRSKVLFSDGVSTSEERSWFTLLEEFVDRQVR